LSMPRKPKQTPIETPSSSKPKRSRKTPAPATPEAAQPTSEPNTPHSALRIPHSKEESAMVEEFRARYPFALDPFQEEAIAHLATGESVMVAAPTGTGKTVLAEFGVFRAARKGFKVMYTTPIKAL